MNLTLASNSDLDAIALRQDRKSKFLLYREMEATSQKEWLVHGLLGAGDASAFYGVPGCGKSVLIKDMALHIAAGREWHGRAVQHGAVLYVALERKKPVERRAIAFRERHAITDIPFALVGGVFDLQGQNQCRHHSAHSPILDRVQARTLPMQRVECARRGRGTTSRHFSNFGRSHRSWRRHSDRIRNQRTPAGQLD
jgi:AAA domain-containing protein